jgi:6-pyruvoyltetrahydropterin/6-carboxytetrahydropterin synthase
MHGHNYVVEVTIASKKLKAPGLVEDFVKVKKTLRRILPDHKLLNDILPVTPTAEHLAKLFYDRLRRQYSVQKVTVWENDECCAAYEPDA